MSLERECVLAQNLLCSLSEIENIGLLLTKDDGKIVYEWLTHNHKYFTGLIVLDGSVESNDAKTLFTCQEVTNIKYYHESQFSSLQKFSDGELRALGHALVTKHFGYDLWITMLHTDEFFLHNPLKVIQKAEKEGADHVKWRALHVLPHVSEYENYLSSPGAPVADLFHHYYHFGPLKGSFLEDRMFLSVPGLVWDSSQGKVIPSYLKKSLSVHPSYLHYKVHNLSSSTYNTNGIHKNHWNKVSEDSYRKKISKRGVGIRWKIQSTRDFFVDHFPNSNKYKYISIFKNGKIEDYLEIGESFKGLTVCE